MTIEHDRAVQAQTVFEVENRKAREATLKDVFSTINILVPEPSATITLSTTLSSLVGLTASTIATILSNRSGLTIEEADIDMDKMVVGDIVNLVDRIKIEADIADGDGSDDGETDPPGEEEPPTEPEPTTVTNVQVLTSVKEALGDASPTTEADDAATLTELIADNTEVTVADIQAQLELDFSVTFEDGEVVGETTIGELVTLINTKLAAAGTP